MTKNDINCYFDSLIPIDFVGKWFYIYTVHLKEGATQDDKTSWRTWSAI